MFSLANLIFQKAACMLLPDLAPALFCGCRGIYGPVPPPLLMSDVKKSELAAILPHYAFVDKFFI